MTISHLKCIELFTGGGGLALGLHQSGFEHVGLVEWDPHARQTIIENNRRNFYGHPWPLLDEPDARKVNYSEFKGAADLVAGGVPCQPFSIGGTHKAHLDARDMFPAAISAVKAIRPKAFLFENVPGLGRPAFADYVDFIRKKLSRPASNVSYNVQFVKLCCADYGAPQLRYRVMFVGVRKDLELEWKLPPASHSKAALLKDMVSGHYWSRHGLKRPRELPSKTQHLLVANEKPWETVRDAFAALPEPSRTANRVDKDANQHVLIPGAREYKGHTASILDWPAKTLKAGVHGVPGGENMVKLDNGRVRYFTVREAATLQGFPADYLFEGSWVETMRQIGNAVPVMTARAIGQSLHALLSSIR